MEGYFAKKYLSLAKGEFRIMNMRESLRELYPKLYGEGVDSEKMDRRFDRLISDHEQLFGKKNEIMIFSSSGRTEIAGNHTDHNHGKAIGGSVNLDTIAAVTKRDDKRVIIKSEGYPVVDIDISDLSIREDEKNTTNALLRGIAKAFEERGVEVSGWEGNTSSNVLKGSGLSSSAAVEVLAAEIFDHIYNGDKSSPLELSKIGKYAENVYFDKPSGLLDQICSSAGGVSYIDFSNNENPEVEKLDVDFDALGYPMIITDTRGDHADLTMEYAAVPVEMKKVASYFGKEYLSEVKYDDFLSSISDIRKSVCDDRAILRAYHFFTENERVEMMRRELIDGDIETFLMLVSDSGSSSYKYLQNVYPASDVKNQGLSLALALSEEVLSGEGAVRVHGGGFAGTIQAYVPPYLEKRYIERMESIFGRGCSIHISIRKLPVGRIF